MKNMKNIRNLKSKKGSALMTVLICMTLLAVLATAFLQMTLSEGENIKKVISEEQAYQNAIAVNDWVVDYLQSYTDLTKDYSDDTKLETENKLLKSIIELEVGKKLYYPSDNSSEFKALSTLLNIDSLSEYRIEIEKITKSDTDHEFIITTIVRYNVGMLRLYQSDSDNVAGYEEVVINRRCQMSFPVTISGEKELFFKIITTQPGTTTQSVAGYNTTGDTHFGNDLVEFSNGQIYHSIYAAKDLFLKNDGTDIVATNPINIVSGRNLYTDAPRVSMFTNGGNVIVGGTMTGPFTIKGKSNPTDNETYVYILGKPDDPLNPPAYAYEHEAIIQGKPVFFVNGNVKLSAPTNDAIFFINGNLDIGISGGDTAWHAHNGEFYVSGNINFLNHTTNSNAKYYALGGLNTNDFNGDGTFYVKGAINGSGAVNSQTFSAFDWGITSTAWPTNSYTPEAFPHKDILTVDDVTALLASTFEMTDPADNTKTVELAAPEWDVIESLEKIRDDTSLPQSQRDEAAAQLADIATPISLFVGREYDFNGGREVFPTSTVHITRSGNISTHTGDDGYGHIVDKGYLHAGTSCILVDTMAEASDPSDPLTHKDIYIRLTDNTSGGKFRWTKDPYNNSGTVNIIVRGAGNVIFFLDDGVDYEVAGGGVSVIHEGWLREAGVKPLNPIDGEFGAMYNYGSFSMPIEYGFTGSGFYIDGSGNPVYAVATNNMKYNASRSGNAIYWLTNEIISKSGMSLENFGKKIKDDYIHEDKYCIGENGVTSCVYCDTIKAEVLAGTYKGAWPGNNLIRQDNVHNLIKKYGATAINPEDKVFLHNNIFFVTESADSDFSGNKLDMFSSGSQKMIFSGFIYARNRTVKYGAGSGESVFLGGILAAALETNNGAVPKHNHLMPSSLYSGAKHADGSYDFDRNIMAKLIQEDIYGGGSKTSGTPDFRFEVGY